VDTLVHRDLTDSILNAFYSVVVIELKAARALDPSHEAQILNYLRATELEVGLLLNFGPKPASKRVAFSNTRKLIRVHPR